MARQLVASMVGEFDPEDYANEYRGELRAMLDAKPRGEISVPEPAEPAQVIDLMEALKESVHRRRRPSPRPRRPRRSLRVRARRPVPAPASPWAAPGPRPPSAPGRGSCRSCPGRSEWTPQHTRTISSRSILSSLRALRASGGWARSSPPSAQGAKKPAGSGSGGHGAHTQFPVTKLNGFVLLLRPWSQDTVSGVTAATLLRGFERRVVEIAGLRTRYWVGGDGPPLVLVHGLGGARGTSPTSPRSWLRVTACSPSTCPATAGRSCCPSSKACPTWQCTSPLSQATRTWLLRPSSATPWAALSRSGSPSRGPRPSPRSSWSRPPASCPRPGARRSGWSRCRPSARRGRSPASSRLLARRPNLRLPVFGYWGAEDPRLLSPESVVGFPRGPAGAH